MITLRQLRYLASLARHRHFGRAAEDCAISQPALSMQVRELEREIGAELVERRPGDIALTDIGLEVARRAEQHPRRHARPRRLRPPPRRAAQARSSSASSRRWRLTCCRACCRGLQAKYPNLRLEVRETQTKLLIDELAARRTRLRRCWRCRSKAPTSRRCALFDDPFLLAVPAADALPARGRVDVADVDQRRLILLEEGHCLRDQALAFCATKRRDQPAGLGATSLATVMQMVANGYGVTLLPEVAVDAEARDARVKLLRFAAPEPGRTIGLACRRTSPRKKDFEALGQIIMEMTGGKTPVRPSTRTASGNRGRS